MNPFVEGARVCDDSSNVSSDISDIGEGTWNIPIPSEPWLRGVRGQGIIPTARWEPGQGKLVPPAGVNIGVRETKLLDVVENLLFL